MKQLTFIFLIFINCSLTIAQTIKRAIINDSDGFTNIRVDKGTSFKILDKVYDYEVFNVTYIPNEKWLKIHLTKCACDGNSSYSKDITGYIHNSKIQLVESLNTIESEELFTRIFNKELDNIKHFQSINDKSSQNYKIARNQLVVYHELTFDLVLNDFSKYICETKNENLFKLFNKTLVTDKGSADELPSVTVGEIFLCHPNWTITHIPQTKEFFLGQLEWGFVNSNQLNNEILQEKLNQYREYIDLELIDYNNYEF